MKQTTRMPVFRDNLRELMGDLSVTDFAQKIGLSRQTVGFYLNGDRIPDCETLVQICQKCNVSANWLLGLSGPKNPNPEIAEIMHHTGLSEDSISFLKATNNVRTLFDEYNRLNRENWKSNETHQTAQNVRNAIAELKFLDSLRNDDRSLWDYAYICSHFEPVLVDTLLSAIQNNYRIIADFYDLCEADPIKWKHEDELLSYDDYIRFKSGEISKAIDRYLVDRFRDRRKSAIYYDHITEEYGYLYRYED